MHAKSEVHVCIVRREMQAESKALAPGGAARKPMGVSVQDATADEGAGDDDEVRTCRTNSALVQGPCNSVSFQL
eukprot:1159088-Pelagomonas_calceolata.AAC.6